MPIISNFPCKIPTASQIAYDNDSSVAEAIDNIAAATSKAQSTADTAKTAADAAADNITNITNGTTKVGNSNKLNGQAASYYAKASDVSAITNSKGATNGIATLDANKKLVQMPTLADVGGVNRNLLHNWYFANPVNSRGKSEYTQQGYGICPTIDRWVTWLGGSVKVAEGGIKLFAKNQYERVMQQLHDYQKHIGQEVTFSVLFSDVAQPLVIELNFDSNSFKQLAVTEPGLYSVTATVPENAVRLYAMVVKMSETFDELTEMCSITAAKLETGNEQTLAKKDSDGNWVLCELPDRAEQAAICAQYDLNDNYIGADRSVHRNYLHNWYFAKPVNSKGLSVYPQGDAAIFIDRWQKNGALEASLTDDGIVISATSNAAVSFYQFVDTVKEGLNGREVTASVLLKSSTKPGMDMYYHDGTSQISLASVSGSFTDGETGVMTKTFTVPENAIGITVQFIPSSEGTDRCADTTFIAAKLEAGGCSTLAKADGSGGLILADTPDYAEQAAICAQYDPNYATSWTDCHYIGPGKAFAPVREYTANMTLGSADGGCFLSINSASDVTVTVPANADVAFPTGSELEICRMGAGSVTIAAASGVTINSVGGNLSIAEQYGSAALKKIAANKWLLSGNLG